MSDLVPNISFFPSDSDGDMILQGDALVEITIMSS